MKRSEAQRIIDHEVAKALIKKIVLDEVQKRLQSDKRLAIIEARNFNEDDWVRDKGKFSEYVGEKDSDSKDEAAGKASAYRPPKDPRQDLEERIKNGVYKTTVNQEKQNRHFEGTKEYQDKRKEGIHPSLLTIKPEEVQGLIDKYTETGTAYYSKRRNNGTIRVQFIHDSNIGTTFDATGNNPNDTKAGIINYSKKGAHIVPVKEWGQNEE